MKKPAILSFLTDLQTLPGVDLAKLAELRAHHEAIGTGRKRKYASVRERQKAYRDEIAAEAKAKGVSAREILFQRSLRRRKTQSDKGRTEKYD